MISEESTDSSAVNYRLAGVSFLAICAVVMIHSRMVAPHVYHISGLIQNFLTHGLTVWAVPSFFVISGYWFAKTSSSRSIIEIWRRKWRSLIVPYLLWCVIIVGGNTALIIGQNYSHNMPLASGTILDVSSILGAVDLLFGLSYFSPYRYVPLWFLRTLVLIFLLVPVWRLLCHNAFILSAAVILFLSSNVFVPYLECDTINLGWVLLGVLTARRNWTEIKWTKASLLVCAAAYIVGAIVVAFAECGPINAPKIVYTLTALLALPVWWKIAGIICGLDSFGARIPQYGRMTFWIYCSHGLIAIPLMRLAQHWFRDDGIVAVFVGMIVPMLVVSISIWSGRIFGGCAPYLYGLLTGGRIPSPIKAQDK